MKIIQSTAEFAGLEEIWNDLLSRSPANNFFLTWEWLWTWWQFYAETGDTLAIFIREQDNTISGIAPCYVRTTKLFRIIPVRQLCFLGTQSNSGGDVGSEYMDLIYLNGDEINFVKELFETIVGENLCDEMYFKNLGNNSLTVNLFYQEAVRYGIFRITSDICTCPFIQLPATWDEYLRSCSSSMRYKIKKERNRIEECKTITVKQAITSNDLKTAFHELTELHKKRWNSRGMNGVFGNAKFFKFHCAVMPLLLKKGNLELIVLYENKQSRAAIYNILYNNKIYFYQSGIDTISPSIAFGYLLHCYCIEQAINNSHREYDFLLKGQSDGYKERFSNSHREIVSVTIIRSNHLIVLKKGEEFIRRLYRRAKLYFNDN